MGAMKENTRNNVVSIRLSDVERKALMDVCKKSNKSVSKMMREVITLMFFKGENSRTPLFDKFTDVAAESDIFLIHRSTTTQREVQDET